MSIMVILCVGECDRDCDCACACACIYVSAMRYDASVILNMVFDFCRTKAQA